MVNSQQVYVFLIGLDSHLDRVCAHILTTTLLPNVQSVYATVYIEANRQEAMLGGEPSEEFVFVVNKYPNKGVCKCTYCNTYNRLVETCFKPMIIRICTKKAKLFPITRQKTSRFITLPLSNL